MTTIAYRDGILAADRQLTGGSVADCETTKVARNAAGDLAGFAGPAAYIYRFLDWFQGGEKHDAPLPDKEEGGEGVIVRADGSIEVYDRNGKSRIVAKTYAFGSGLQVAYGAMLHGASAAEAVVAASKYDIYTGATVDTVAHAG